MKDSALKTERLARVFGSPLLTGAKGAEILGRDRGHIFEELKLDASLWLVVELDVEENARICRRGVWVFLLIHMEKKHNKF